MLILFALIIAGLISVFGWWLIPLLLLNALFESAGDEAKAKRRAEELAENPEEARRIAAYCASYWERQAQEKAKR